MSRFSQRKPTAAMIVATLALFISLSGVGFAAVKLANNSVLSKHIKDGQVRNADLANNSVSSTKIKNGVITSDDIADGSIATADLVAGAVTPAKTSGVPTVRAFNAANVTVPNLTFVPVPLNSERFDASGMHRTDVDTSRLTVTTPGIYLITGNVTWANNTTGARELNIRKNGGAIVARAVQPSDPTINTTDQIVTTTVQLAAGDFVELVARHNAGAPLTITAAAEFSPEFSAVWLANG
jgi:hypothetical protein